MSTRTISAVLLAGLLGVTAAGYVPAQAGTPKCFGKEPTIVQREGQSLIRGTPGNDVIVVRNGSGNHVKARGGRDRVCDRGHYSLIQGGAGRDHIGAGKDDDTLYGGDGDDVMKGGVGSRDGDESFGGKGDDLIDGGRGLDFIYGEQGNDSLRSGHYSEGGPGDDAIYGTGRTVVIYENATQGVVVDLGERTATGEGADSFPEGGIIGVIGSQFNDQIEGTGADYNSFAGGAGEDVIRGLGGADTMYGQGGNDRLEGGAGEDAAAGGKGTDECEAEHQDHCEVELFSLAIS